MSRPVRTNRTNVPGICLSETLRACEDRGQVPICARFITVGADSRNGQQLMQTGRLAGMAMNRRISAPSCRTCAAEFVGAGAHED